MTDPAEVLAFLLARLAEDEDASLAASGGPWRYDPSKQWHRPPAALGVISPGEEYVARGPGDAVECVAATGPADDPQAMADATYIARWNPTRTRIDAAAKRMVLARFDQPAFHSPDHKACAACFLLISLAWPYSDHPDFDRTWREAWL